MIREEEFRISRRPYAVNLDGLRKRWQRIERRVPVPGAREGFWDCRIDAVWFRRRRGQLVACSGELWDFQDDEPQDAVEFLERHEDGRYGGNAEARWDGSSIWTCGLTLDDQNLRLEILRPMLENFPAVPPGYDGWWRF
jgi:hypothetical protein